MARCCENEYFIRIEKNENNIDSQERSGKINVYLNIHR